ncbi:hypothetical protein ABKN59_001269 [Abortiporus biennis]
MHFIFYQQAVGWHCVSKLSARRLPSFLFRWTTKTTPGCNIPMPDECETWFDLILGSFTTVSAQLVYLWQTSFQESKGRMMIGFCVSCSLALYHSKSWIYRESETYPNYSCTLCRERNVYFTVRYCVAQWRAVGVIGAVDDNGFILPAEIVKRVRHGSGIPSTYAVLDSPCPPHYPPLHPPLLRLSLYSVSRQKYNLSEAPSTSMEFEVFARAGGDDTHAHTSPYGYTPTLWICAIFIALFSLSTLIHIGQATYFRMWWLFPTACLAGLIEIIGWSGRIWSSKNVLLLDPFLMQITTTIIAPTPLVAANFVILGRLIQRLGPSYSRLSGKWYLIVFTSADIIALIIQAVGGANASEAVQDGRDPAKGGRIMLGGIAFQLAAISIYSILATEFLIRFLYDRPVRRKNVESSKGNQLDRKTELMFTGLAFSSVLLFIRSVYRTIELADGWDGRIITTQVYFNVLDGAMITLAMFCLNIFHPGWFLLEAPRTGGSDDDLSTKQEVKAGISDV